MRTRGLRIACRFQSRNRGSSLFNKNRFRLDINFSCGCFNLVIEVLLFSTFSKVLRYRDFSKFQSRNRGSSLFNAAALEWFNENKPSFNLVIEVLLFSTQGTRHRARLRFLCFNLVIEVLLFSTLHGYPTENGSA